MPDCFDKVKSIQDIISLWLNSKRDMKLLTYILIS